MLFTATQKPKPILIAVILMNLLAPDTRAAGEEQNIINQQDWITRNQQKVIEEENRTKELEVIKKERERKKKLEQKDGFDVKSNQKTVQTKPSAQCFTINEIKLIDAQLISKFRQKKLLQPFLGKCFEAKILSEITKLVNNYYHKKGYITAQIFVPRQNIQDGSLELKVIEGRIEEISLGENSFTDKMQKLTAFGNIEGEIFDLDEVNQGIYQINRLPSNSAVMKIEPGSKEGESKIIIANQKKFPARANIGYDNLGNEFTGINRNIFGAAFDNLLFLNDNINLNYSTNLKDPNQQKDIRSLSAAISIPWHYYTLSFDYSQSDFLGLNKGINGPIKLTGFSDRKNFTLDRLLINKGNFRLAANAALTQKESASYLNYQKIATSQRKLTLATFGLSISHAFKDGTNIYLKPSFVKGLKILDAKKDAANLAANIPKAQFEALKLYASVSKRLVIPKINTPLVLSSELESQLARNTLFGSEQFGVGGYYSVRGFRENYITGDSGYYFRNKANISLGAIMAPFTKNSKILAKNLSYLDKVKIEPFYDYGHIQNKANHDSGRLSGAGVKTILNSKYFNASVTYSTALQRSKLITSTPKENKMVYFELSMMCC